MHIQLSLSLHFYLFYLLLDSYDGKDIKQCAFSVDCWWLCSVLALKSASFSLVYVQSDVLLPSCMHTTAFAIDQQLRHFVICLAMCH